MEKRQGRVYDESKDLRSSLCYYFSIILVLTAFIFSSLSLGLCSTVMDFEEFLLIVYNYGEDLYL